MKGKVQDYGNTHHRRKNRDQLYTLRRLLLARPHITRRKRKTNRCLGAKALRYLKKHKRLVYLNLLTSGKLNEYLASVNEQAEDMFLAGKGICRQAGSGEAVEIGKSD